MDYTTQSDDWYEPHKSDEPRYYGDYAYDVSDAEQREMFGIPTGYVADYEFEDNLDIPEDEDDSVPGDTYMDGSRKPDYPDNPCNCEHPEHFSDLPQYDPNQHEYMKSPAGTQKALYVGDICDACAKGHYAQFLYK